MIDSAISSAQQDESAVAAVRRGDAERYRELVERHERRVFAVAWSSLGDATLAEEAAQEAFIRAYQRLWLLGDGAKFSGWISTITRRVAINFGLRHRRELNKRERWALDNPEIFAEENSDDDSEPLHTPETLRRTLAELPAAHRECLVLFYIEGKSGAEAAAALGISESALRVRLHRARAAMRERLEEKLEGSLARLRPSKSLVPAIMAGVLASSSAKAATGGTVAVGVGAKILSTVGKTFLFSWLVPLLLLISVLPSLGFAWFVGRMEQRNFRDSDGFRPKLHRQSFRSFAWGYPLLFVIIVIIIPWALAASGIKKQQLFLPGFLVMITLIAARSLTVCRNQYQIGMFAYCVILAVGISSLALGWIPKGLAQLPMLVSTVLFLLIFKKRPTRMDYSLFLRAAHGLLKFSNEADNSAQANHFDRQSLLAFARFLGSRFLVSNFRWEVNGLVLRLPPVGNRFLTNMASVFMPAISQNCSHILLGWDGTIRAHCGKADESDLAALKTGGMTDPKELEDAVAESVGQAWQEFRNGNSAGAERALGELPESEVFVVSPTRAKSTRWWRVFIGATIVLMIVGMVGLSWQPVWLSGLKPVAITEAQVHEFMSLVNTNPNPRIKINGESGWTQKSFAWEPFMPLSTCLVLPETNLFAPRGLQAMRDTIIGSGDFETWRQSPPSQRVQRVLYNSQCYRALLDGWISWEDLDLLPVDCEAYLHTNRFPIFETKNWERFFTHGHSWSWVNSERFPVMRIYAHGVVELRFLKEVNSLDLVDREKLIAQIASVQTLSGSPPGQPPIHNWRDVRGLFFTPCWPALQDTYFSLAALEILGGLDKIDRDACVKGILKRHQGRGFFSSPNSGGYNEYHIDGSARDTIAAFESLRILGSLHRVNDLEKWQFRPSRHGVAKNELTWNDVEAWVCQQRLGKILRERGKNPQAPIRSLLEP